MPAVEKTAALLGPRTPPNISGMVSGSITVKVEDREMDGVTPPCSPNSLRVSDKACSGLKSFITHLLVGSFIRQGTLPHWPNREWVLQPFPANASSSIEIPDSSFNASRISRDPLSWICFTVAYSASTWESEYRPLLFFRLTYSRSRMEGPIVTAGLVGKRGQIIQLPQPFFKNREYRYL